ncbi:MAG: hypothetical protein V4701_01220 [Pseudomonadota bacterium]
MRLKAFTTLVALASASAALAQDATDDWDSFVQPDNRVTMASVQFTETVSIIVRCQDGGLDAVMTGLPPITGVDRRELMLKFADDETPSPTYWNVGVDPSVGVSERPAGFARQLRQGGRLDVIVPGGGENGRNLRYALDLPTSHAVIDRTLAACGKPIEDPREAAAADLGESGLPVGFVWAQQPRPQYPSGRRVYERGFAVVTCLSEPDGNLTACEVETEHPRDGGFGEATLDATRRARVENSAAPGQPIPPRIVQFRSSYSMESVGDAALRSTRATRAPERPN